jgi:hypothetical protein
VTESTFGDRELDRDEILEAADDDEVGLDEEEDEDFDGDEDEEEDEEEEAEEADE